MAFYSECAQFANSATQAGRTSRIPFIERNNREPKHLASALPRHGRGAAFTLTVEVTAPTSVVNPRPRFVKPLELESPSQSRDSTSWITLLPDSTRNRRQSPADQDIEQLDVLANQLTSQLEQLQQELSILEVARTVKHAEAPTTSGPRLVTRDTHTDTLAWRPATDGLVSRTRAQRVRRREEVPMHMASNTPSHAATSKSSHRRDAAASLMNSLYSRAVLSKQEESSLLQVVKEYMHMDNCKAQLAKQIQREPTWDELARYTHMEAGPLSELFSLGKQAKALVVHYNLRLVTSVAKKFQGQGLPLTDLVEEGIHGLLHSLIKFDASKGFKLSTYATWWIRQSIQKAVRMQTGLIRVPHNIWEDVSKMRTAWQRASLDLGREPTDGEVARQLGWDAAKIRKVRGYFKLVDDRTMSLEMPTDQNGHKDGGQQALQEQVEAGQDLDADGGSTPQDAERFSQEAFLVRSLGSSLARLDPVHAYVLRMRLGVAEVDERRHEAGPADAYVKSLHEIAKELGLSVERVRQVYASALQQLRKDQVLKNEIADSLMQSQEAPVRGPGGAYKKVQ